MDNQRKQEKGKNTNWRMSYMHTASLLFRDGMLWGGSCKWKSIVFIVSSLHRPSITQGHGIANWKIFFLCVLLCIFKTIPCWECISGLLSDTVWKYREHLRLWVCCLVLDVVILNLLECVNTSSLFKRHLIYFLSQTLKKMYADTDSHCLQSGLII